MAQCVEHPTRQRSRVRDGALVAVAALVTSHAAAEPARYVRGVVASLDGYALSVDTEGARRVVVRLAPDYGVSALVAAKPEDIRPGLYVGTVATRHADGMLTAREIHIFPGNLRGAGQGQQPFALGLADTVTAGTVEQAALDALGGTMTLTYPGGESVVDVPPDAPVVRFTPGRRAMLVPGAHVVVQPGETRGAEPTADRVIVGIDGLIPPM